MDSLERVAQGCALAVMLVGAAVLAGWALGIEGLKSVLPGLATMKANTALCFILAGAALALRGRPWPRRVCAGAVLALAGLTLFQDLAAMDFGIDQFLFRDVPGGGQAEAPGRMSPATAAGFIFSSAALLLTDARPAMARGAAEALALAAGVAGAIALLGYAYDVEQLYHLPGYTSMALHTATAFVVLAAGIVCARPDGIAGVFASPGIGGQLARRLLPVALLLPAVLGWLNALGQQAGHYGPVQGTALFASAMILALGALIWRAALSLEASDTERTRAGQALAESRARLAGIVESAMDAIITVDAGQRVVLFNAAAERMFGCSEAEALGTPVERFIPARFRDAHARHFADFARTGETSRVMGRLGALSGLRSNGEEFPIEASISHVEVHGRKLFTVILRDVTEFKRSEEQVRSVALFPEENPHPVLRAAGDGTLLFANGAAAGLLQQWNCRVGGRVPEPVREGAMRALETGERQELEIRCGARDLSFVLVPIAARHYVNLYGRDFTERMQAEAALRDYAERLQVLSRRLIEVQEGERRAIARELHDEIGQALTAVKIRLQAAQRRLHNGVAAPDLGEGVEIVEEAIQRVRNRSLDLRPSLLDDLGLTPTIRWFLERHARHAGLTAELAAEPLVPRPPAEVETSCFRVVQEAVTNAIRHAHARNLRIELGARAGRLELSIRDDGVGFNVAAARRRALEGGSIGLLGMEERVELLGGRIEIDSGLGRGTLIRVTLPVPDDGGGAAEDGIPEAGPQ